MVVQFEKCELKIDQIHKEEFSKESFVEHEIKVIELIQGWLNQKQSFEFKTSGSTGKAKAILIERKKIEYSCETTMERLDPHGRFTSILLCINPQMIGGAMVVFRALTHQLNLRVIIPSSNPFKYLNSESTFDLTSMVPMQIHSATPAQLNMFDTILVGGGQYDSNRESTTARIYSTFGMTETVSHFALKLVDRDEYECLGDMRIEKQDDKKLTIEGTLTGHKKLKTNDLIDFISTRKFKWIGRADFVINSGGVKISPEEVEAQLAENLRRSFIISYLKDEVLENRVILIIEGEPFAFDSEFSALEKYQKPKEVYFLNTFVRTFSQKIDRIKTRQLLLEGLNF